MTAESSVELVEVWTCLSCDHTEEVTDGEDGQPRPPSFPQGCDLSCLFVMALVPAVEPPGQATTPPVVKGAVRRGR